MPAKPQTEPTVHNILAKSPTNWGKWGPSDEVGALNYLGKDEILGGVQFVRQGKVFTLQCQMCNPKGDPVSASRRPALRFMRIDQGSWSGNLAPVIEGGARNADDFMVTYLQGTTQYDALGHVWYDDIIYNGYSANSTIGGLTKASVLPIAEKGIVGRGVLVDIARYRGKPYLEVGESYGHEDILAAAAAQGVELAKRDIVLLRTGRMRFFREVSIQEFQQSAPEPGLAYSAPTVSWFQQMEIPNLVSDTFGIEIAVDPSTGTKLLIHCALMRNLGIALTEVCDLEALADDCAQDGQWDFLYVAAPLKVMYGSGSPVNPIAVK
jgi:kynurenine formamidase